METEEGHAASPSSYDPTRDIVLAAYRGDVAHVKRVLRGIANEEVAKLS